MCTGSRLTLLLKHADRTLPHKPLSTTEGQRVVLMNLGYLAEIRGDSINSGHRWSENGSYRRGWVPRRKNCTCDLMMSCASADITDGTARTSIIRHSLMPMLPSESSIYHTNLGTTISRVYTSTVLTRVKYNPGQNNPGYICVTSTHDIPHARARHCDGGKRSRNRYSVILTYRCSSKMTERGLCVYSS